MESIDDTDLDSHYSLSAQSSSDSEDTYGDIRRRTRKCELLLYITHLQIYKYIVGHFNLITFTVFTKTSVNDSIDFAMIYI